MWVPLLANLVAGHNERPHVALGSAPPNRVGAGDEMMDLMILKANTSKMERSAQAWLKSKRGIEVGSKVRLKLKQQTRQFQRGTAAQYSNRVHTVVRMYQDGRMKETDDGSKATTKSVLPVPATAVNVPQGPLDLALRRRRETVAARRGGGAA